MFLMVAFDMIWHRLKIITILFKSKENIYGIINLAACKRSPLDVVMAGAMWLSSYNSLEFKTWQPPDAILMVFH